MKLSGIAIRRPVTTTMCVLIVILLGVVSFGGLGLDLLPDINFPMAIVSVSYSGAGPMEVESLVTRPLESVLGTVANIKSISSVSAEGNATVLVEFASGTDMDFATLDMREKVDMIRGMLPEGTGAPMILKMDPNMIPIIEMAISSDGDIASLTTLVDDSIVPRIERLEGVAVVDVYGGREREVRIEVYPERLKGYGLSLMHIVQSLRAENLNLPGGSVDDGNKRYILRTTGEFQSVEEIGEIPIALPAGGVIKLQDIADIQDTFKEASTVMTANGKHSIDLSVRKESTANSVQVARRINAELERIEQDYKGIEIKTIVDTSTFIQKTIDNVTGMAVSGGLLAIGVLYLFLRNFRTTLIIGVAIPISIIATFTLIYFNGLTLNMVSLGGLALGVGMLVDNSIVVLENIFRYRQEGHNRIDAAREGSDEISMAVVASTLTTVAVFVPVVFVEGIAAEVFREMALTVSFSLMASLVVALTLVPMLSSKYLRVSNNGEKRLKIKFVSSALDLWNKGFDKLDRLYRRVLAWALRHRKIAIIGMVVLFVVSLLSAALVGAEFFPSMDQGYITVSISLPRGTVLEETGRIAYRIEDMVASIPEMEDVFVVLGSGGGMGGSDTSSAIIYGKLVDMGERSRSSFEVADSLRQRVADIAGAEINVSSMAMGGFAAGGSPVNIQIKGDDLTELSVIAEDVKGIVARVEGTRETASSLDEGKPEARVIVDRKRASIYGLNVSAIASTVQGSVDGQVATRYRMGGEEIDIRVALREDSAGDLHNLGNIIIPSPAGFQVPLEEVADVTIGEGPSSINRADQARVVTVSSEVFGRDLSSVMKDIRAGIDRYPLPEGYTIEYGGENQEMVDAFTSLAKALVMAIILVYMIMASQFESLVYPFIIMFSVPFALTGAVGGLVLTGRSLNVASFLGIIMLTGIVVNNAIVLVDYINTLRSRGTERNEAILKAGPVRLRPILMTTLTTILGLIPMALGIGEGAELQAPLATAVICGLLFSTVLTLVVIPVMYTIVDDIGIRLRRKFKTKGTVVVDS
ncbi:MAG: efflux RND transporter permease subunit [Clostridia bacterium]|jgi:HAE1 family hydrophobic/amphiphilic exporter-1|nr:efflux RND transporter permease subunit [Clostridiales bacterium]